MTAPGVPDEAISAFIAGWMTIADRSTFGEHVHAGLAAALPHLTAPGSLDDAITAALDAQAGHLLNLTVEVCSCGQPWTDVRDWARHRMAEGLDAALTVLAVAVAEPTPNRLPKASDAP